MVQEYTSPVRVYEYPFEMVMKAYQKRFPTCKMIPAFLGSEITYEYKSEDEAIHIVERRCRLHVDAPYLVRKMAGVDHAIFIQRNSLDRLSRTLKIEAWNESFSSRLIIKENCYYSVDPSNSNHTLFEQDASLDVVSFFGFEAAVEKLAIKAYTNNLKKGKEIIMHYINELLEQGHTYFPPFKGSEGRPRSISSSEKEVVHALDNEEEVVAEDVDGRRGSHERRGSRTSPDDEDTHEESGEKLSVSVDEHGLPKNAEDIGKVIEPPPVQEYKLDEIYIARFLGDLSMREENHLMQLRRRFQATHSGKVPGEAVMLRFLRARDTNLDKAYEMLRNSLQWRRTHHVDTILDTWNPPTKLLEYYPGGWHHYDKENRPVYIVRLGSMDFKGLLKTVGEDGFVKHVVSINEEGLQKCREATEIFQTPITNWSLIVDLDGLSMRHLWRPGIRALLKIIEVVEANYPETMGRLLIIRAPKVFGVLWTLLYPFIDENSRKKFLIYTGDDYQGPGGLADYIPKEYIPTFLGGQGECNIPEGRPVPKDFYKFLHIGEAVESSWLETDLYHTGHVVKGTPHEVILTITEAECVITWDFDVIEGDCVFQLLRHKRPREATQVTNCLADATKQAIRPGIDAQVVERPIVCVQENSIQGTHICQQAGVFILQWKYSSPTQHTARPALKIQHKTKIMYYYEILPSRDFKGSMTSMSSSQSGFSQLSMGLNSMSLGQRSSSSVLTTSQSSER